MTLPDTNSGWAVYEMPAEVAPIDDLKPHNIGENCWCKPFFRDDVIVHNAMDQREYYEPDSLHKKRNPS